MEIIAEVELYCTAKKELSFKCVNFHGYCLNHKRTNYYKFKVNRSGYTQR